MTKQKSGILVTSPKSQKAIIFDSGTLISLVMAGLLPELKELKKIFDGKFIITENVRTEVVDRPINIKRFELEALKVQQLIDEKILEFPETFGVSHEEIEKETDKFMDLANSMMSAKKRDVKLVHSGEASCLALGKILGKKGIENLIAIDERTTRLLSEKPENLKELMERRLHMPVRLKNNNYQYFSGFKFVRSTELMYVAYKKGLMRWKNEKLLDAVLYALKFSGAAITGDEIREIKSL